MSVTRASKFLSGADHGKTIALPDKPPHGRIKTITQNSGFTVVSVYNDTNQTWIPPLAVRRETEATITGAVVSP